MPWNEFEPKVNACLSKTIQVPHANAVINAYKLDFSRVLIDVPARSMVANTTNTIPIHSSLESNSSKKKNENTAEINGVQAVIDRTIASLPFDIANIKQTLPIAARTPLIVAGK